MPLTPVSDALGRLLGEVSPTATETVPLNEAFGRILAEDLSAGRAQPPFNASAMDGYAVRSEDARRGAVLKVIGQSRAGQRFRGVVGNDQAVRIFTGAPVPQGADAILIQENATAAGDGITVDEPVEPGRFIRPEGLDFKSGDELLTAGTVLTARTIALAASMNRPHLTVRRKPRVAILATGDELVPPGASPGDDQIISSNGVGISILVEASGGEAVDLGIAADTIAAIEAALPDPVETDILVIIGGASVGDHDLVQEALTGRGMELDFWRIAMRPGKPLMVGNLRSMKVLGLPGNPVSALVCGHIFLRPLIRKMLGATYRRPEVTARLAGALPANDERQDYIRAVIEREDGEFRAMPFGRQDSSMLATLARSNGLIVRPPHAGALDAGAEVPVLLLDSEI